MTYPPIPQAASPSFAFSTMQRCLLESISERRFTKTDMAETAAYFKDACAYCGDPFQRWDHLIPVFEGGDTVVGNLVPACSSCDSSKGNRLHAEWMQGTAPASPAKRGIADIEVRLLRINAYVAERRYEARPPEVRLTLAKQILYHQIMEKMKDLRKEIEALAESGP